MSRGGEDEVKLEGELEELWVGFVGLVLAELPVELLVGM